MPRRIFTRTLNRTLDIRHVANFTSNLTRDSAKTRRTMRLEIIPDVVAYVSRNIVIYIAGWLSRCILSLRSYAKAIHFAPNCRCFRTAGLWATLLEPQITEFNASWIPSYIFMAASLRRRGIRRWENKKVAINAHNAE